MSFITGYLHRIDSLRMFDTAEEALAHDLYLLSTNPGDPGLTLVTLRVPNLDEVWLVGLLDNFSRTQVHNELSSAEQYRDALTGYFSRNEIALIHLKPKGQPA